MGTVIHNPEVFTTLTKLKGSIRYMEDTNRSSDEPRYIVGLAKERALYRKYLKKLVKEAA